MQGRHRGGVADAVVLDIGYKTEGILPLSEFQNDREAVKPGDKLQVTDAEAFSQHAFGTPSVFLS